MDSHTAAVVIIAVVVIAAIATLGWLFWRQRHSLALRKRFGPEYDRVVQQEGSQRKAEGVLDIRTMRRKKFQIHPLDPMQRDAFANRWTEVQSRFVDDPSGAVVDADQLVNELMSARGYPMADFNQRADDISVDHPQVVEHYRSAHNIAARHSRGQADTEDLRNALVHYRWLYEELLEDRTQPRKEKLA